MGLKAALLLVPFGFGMFGACLVGGLSNLLAAVRKGPTRRETAKRGAAELSAAATLAAVPWVAAPVAESTTGWVDTDNDEMLDGFVNGSYDWVDINGRAWATTAGLMVVVILSGLAFALAAIRASRDRAAARGDAVGGGA